MPPAVVLRPDQTNRFWAKVSKQGPVPEHDPGLGPCWIWTAGKSEGYGVFSLYPDPPRRAHQISWDLHGMGDIASGLVIRHRCDVRACVNPDHLVLGTRADNNADTHERGRWNWVAPGQGRRRAASKRKGPKPMPLAARFWPKVDRNGAVPIHDPSLAPCWLWTGGLYRQGYGRFFVAGKRRDASQAKAHRVSYEIAHGKIPDGLGVLHRCDVRRCVNPAHLYLGTDADNARDRRERGREGDRSGGRNGRAKLTANDIYEIRKALADGETQTSLGLRFGVSQKQISKIASGLAWSHLCPL